MNVFSTEFRRRAIPFGVALFFAFSARGAGKTETYQDIIEKAYTLSLQKDRLQAVNLLVSATRKESKKGQPPKELLAALEEVSGVFYSDKAQQLYELALSLRMTDPTLANQKLAEAIRLEPENQQIMLDQVRMQIGLGDCDGALKQARKMSERNPFSEDVKLVQAQSALCAGQISDYQQMRSLADMKKAGMEIFWQSLELENFFKTGAFAKGRDLALQMQKADGVYPETYYWLWKFQKELKVADDRSGQKYLANCKNLSSRSSRQYLSEPRLCRRTTEVETELKKAGGAGA